MAQKQVGEAGGGVRDFVITSSRLTNIQLSQAGGGSTLWPFPSQLVSLMPAGRRGVRDGEGAANPSPSEDTKKELCSLPRGGRQP